MARVWLVAGGGRRGLSSLAPTRRAPSCSTEKSRSRFERTPDRDPAGIRHTAPELEAEIPKYQTSELVVEIGV